MATQANAARPTGRRRARGTGGTVVLSVRACSQDPVDLAVVVVPKAIKLSESGAPTARSRGSCSWGARGALLGCLVPGGVERGELLGHVAVVEELLRQGVE